MVGMLQDLFKAGCMMQMSLLIPIMAVNFYSFMNSDSSHPFYFYFIYEVLIIMSQFFFFCWFGTRLTSKVYEWQNYICFFFNFFI